MRNIRSLISIALCAVVISGCGSHEIVGKDQATSEIRKVSEFTGVNVSGNYNVLIQVGTTPNVSIISNPNLLPYITTTVKGDTLYVGNKSSVMLKPTGTQTVNLVVRSLKEIELDGANTIDAQGINSDDLTLKFNGSTQGGLMGTVKNMKLVSKGETSIDAKKLLAETATIDISGAANIIVNATKLIDATIMGSGKIQHVGKPKEIKHKIMGSGEITEIATAPVSAPATVPAAKTK